VALNSEVRLALSLLARLLLPLLIGLQWAVIALMSDTLYHGKSLFFLLNFHQTPLFPLQF
jgi:hypothetical protein